MKDKIIARKFYAGLIVDGNYTAPIRSVVSVGFVVNISIILVIVVVVVVVVVVVIVVVVVVVAVVVDYILLTENGCLKLLVCVFIG